MKITKTTSVIPERIVAMGSVFQWLMENIRMGSQMAKKIIPRPNSHALINCARHLRNFSHS